MQATEFLLNLEARSPQDLAFLKVGVLKLVCTVTAVRSPTQVREQIYSTSLHLALKHTGCQ